MSTVSAFLLRHVGVVPLAGFGAADWLLTPAERLLELTSEEVFVDPHGDLTAVRKLLAWYPHDVWLLTMAGHWRRVAQLEHLHGRAGSRADELGASLIASSLVRDRCAWGSSRSAVTRRIRSGSAARTPSFTARSRRRSRRRCERRAGGRASIRSSTHTVSSPSRTTSSGSPSSSIPRFAGWPFRVLFAGRFVEALRAAVTDPDVRAVEHLAGAVDAVSDNTDVLTRPRL